MLKKSGETQERNFKVLIEKDEAGFYVADIPEFQGCHTQAKTRGELMKRVKEVIGLCLEDNTPIKNVEVKEVRIPYVHNNNNSLFA